MKTLVLYRSHGNLPLSAVVEHDEGFSAHNEEDRNSVTNKLANFDYNRGFIFVGPFEEIPDELIAEHGTELEPIEFSVK